MGCALDGGEGFLVVVTDPSANLGRLRHDMMRSAPEVSKAVGF